MKRDQSKGVAASRTSTYRSIEPHPVNARVDFGGIRGWFPHHSMTHKHLLTVFMLTLLAGLGTVVGSCIAFLAERTDHGFLSVTTGFSVGVILYVSFVEIVHKGEVVLAGVGYSDVVAARSCHEIWWDRSSAPWLVPWFTSASMNFSRRVVPAAKGSTVCTAWSAGWW